MKIKISQLDLSPGYTPEQVIKAVAEKARGLYLFCGEGSGYASGIVSSGFDGLCLDEAVIGGFIKLT